MSQQTVEIVVDGKPLRVEEGLNLAVALVRAGVPSFRTSVSGEPRLPLCGMGICFECRVRVGRDAHVRACLISVEAGLRIATGE